MYLGSHAINMDAKGRMAIPTRIREMLVNDCAGSLVITAHAEERCLLVYPKAEWDIVFQRIQGIPNMSKSARRLQRLMIGHACPVELDGSGRMLVPPTLRAYADLDKKLMLIGQGNKLELWSEEAWNAWLNESDDEDSAPEVMQSLSL